MSSDPADMKVNIEVIDGPDIGMQAEFERFPIIIGRSPDCDFVLSDPTVCRRHAFLSWIGEVLHLEDLGKKRTTRVNEVTVTTDCLLPPNAHVGIGSTELKVRWSAVANVTQEAPDTGCFSDEDPLTPTPYEPLELQIHIVTEDGHCRLERFRPPQMVAGRQANCEIHVDDPLMSKAHFRIRQTANAFVLEDLKSLNGTFVGEEEVTSPIPIHGDLEIRAGATRFQIQLVPGAAKPAPVRSEAASYVPPAPPTPASTRPGELSEPPRASSSLSTAPDGGSYRVQRWDEQVHCYQSMGPQPPIAAILAALSRNCPLCMLVDVPGPSSFDEGIPGAALALWEDSWSGAAAGSPMFLSPESRDAALNLAQQMAGHDCWVAYFAYQPAEEVLARLRALSGQVACRVAASGEGSAILARPSLLSKALQQDHAIARDLLGGWKAILMEGSSPGSWMAIAGPGFRRGLERGGLESPIVSTTEISLAGG